MIPNGTQLDSCARTICGVHVQAAPVQTHAGVTEHITIHDPHWPGATAQITINEGSGSVVRRHVRLNLHGLATYLWPVQVPADTSHHSIHVHVTVGLRLGRLTGSGRGEFTVER
jgi:hypothetical protein